MSHLHLRAAQVLRDPEGVEAISGYHASMRLLRAGERRPRNDIKCYGRRR